MKLRLQNSKEHPLRIVLEPWATEMTLATGESIWVIAEGDVPTGAYFDVRSHDYGLIVTPEWTGALAYLCDEAGNKLD